MYYFLCENKADALHIKREISEEEFLQWRKCTEQLKYYSMANHFRDMAIQNGLEVKCFLKDLSKISDLETIRHIDTTKIAKKANRLMLNYLVSFRTFVDNIETYSYHLKCGSKFKDNILSYMHDHEDSYCFFYKLRNFATHFSVVFDSVTVEIDHVNLICTKEHLLEYKKWNAKQLAYINSLHNNSVPILELVESLNVLIMSAYLGFIGYFADDLQDMHNQVMALMHEYQIISPFFLESKSATNYAGAHLFGIGLNILKKATDELAQLPNAKITFVGPDEALTQTS